MACAGVLPVLAQTASGLPEGLNVPTGGGVLSLSGDANTMTITQSTQRAVGDWNESPRVLMWFLNTLFPSKPRRDGRQVLGC